MIYITLSYRIVTKLLTSVGFNPPSFLNQEIYMSANTVTQTIQDSVSSLYIAFFGRAPDAEGFGYWAKEQADGASPYRQADNFALSKEWISQYDGKTPSEQVDLFYNNVFNRNADAAGKTYWVNAINSGTPFSTVAYQIIWAAYLGGPKVDPADNALVLNKITVAKYFAVTLESNDTAIAETAFDGVTQNGATVKAAEDRLYAEVNPAKTYSLTTGADNIVGTAANETINGLLTDANGQQTFQSWDTIDGGAGVNTLNVQNALAAPVLTPSLANIQTLNFQDTVGTGITLNMQGLSTLTTLNLEGASAASGYTVTNLGSLPSVSLSGMAAASTINFTAAALQPTGQTLNMTLNGFTNAAGAAAGGITLSDTGSNALETVSITASGSASNVGGLTTSGLGVTTLNISGNQNLTLGAITDTNSTLRTVNASTATGNISLTAIASSTVTGGAGSDTIISGGGVDSFTGGAGNDTFQFGASLTTSDTVVGGDGTADVLAANAVILGGFTTAAPTTNVSGVERVTSQTAMAGETFTLSAIQAGINTVNVTAAGAAQTGTVVFDSGVAGTVNVGTSTVVSTLGAFTVQSAGTGTTDSITINNVTAGSNAFTAAITATGVETLTLNGSTTAAAIAQAPTTITLTPTGTATSSLVLTGNNSFAPTGIVTADSINASALGLDFNGAQSALTMAAVANTATTITGSAGADTLRGNGTVGSNIAAGAGNDTVFGGTGNDTILGEAGNDVITIGTGIDSVDGGAGNDRVTVASADINATDTIIGGDGTDILEYTTFVSAADDLAVNQARVSGFETLRMGASGVAPGATRTVTLSNYVNNTGFTTIQIDTQGAATDGYAFINAGSGLNTISMLGAVGGVQSFARLVDLPTDSLTVQNADATPAASVIAQLIANNENTITLTSTNVANDLTITRLDAAQLTTLNITGSSAMVVTGLGAGATTLLNTVDASTATGAVTVNAANTGAGVTMTGNSSSTAVATFTGGVLADSITGGAGADILGGGAGADTINGGAGADVITAGAGADRASGGAGVDDFNQGIADSVARSASVFAAATVGIGDTLTFGNGVDIITDFVAGAGGDTMSVLVAGAPTTLLGETVAALSAGTEVFFASGTYNSATNVFTVAANGSGPDTMIVQADVAAAASNALTTNASVVILQGVDSDNLVAGNFIL